MAVQNEILILGAGVAGLSAAHELVERGFRVTVVERRGVVGGKARTIPVPGSGVDGRADLPGEHGFRFFPAFYKHLHDVMRRIPYRDRAGGVFANLVATTHNLLLCRGEAFRPPCDLRADPRATFELARTLAQVHRAGIFEPRALGAFSRRLLQVMTSSEERRRDEYETASWERFLDPEGRYQDAARYLSPAEILVACRSDEVSARTFGCITWQMLASAAERGPLRLLNGPTSQVWLEPWREHLQARGVRFHFETSVEELETDGERITAVRVRDAEGPRRILADGYVCALPLEAMRSVVTPALCHAEPSLAHIGQLRTEWMVGLQLFLDRPAPLVPGHVMFWDSPWALTSVSQAQYWSELDLSRCGDGRVRDVLSVDISSWDTPGIVYGKPARTCTPEEVRDEVLAQIRAQLPEELRRELDAAQVLDWALDPAVRPGADGLLENEEPLFVNTADSWRHRPEAVGRCPNLVLAGDWIRTHTDFASMEAANEAARRAVNGVLDRLGSKAPRCQVWPLREPLALAPLRAIDRWRHRRGRPHLLSSRSDQRVRDMSGFLLVHKAIRRDVRALAEALSARELETASLNAWVERLERVLHVHHESEDSALFPLISWRHADFDVERHRLEAQHVELDRSFLRLRTALASDPPDIDALGREGARLAELVERHLDDEEQAVLPRVIGHMTLTESDALAQAMLAETPMADAGFVFSWMLSAADEEERRRTLSEVPAPVRWMYALLWKRAYEAEQRGREAS